MATRVAIATGDFTAAGTWGLVDATSYLPGEVNSEVLTTAYSGTRSATFTPGAIVVSHLGVKLSVRTGTTGTMSVELITGGVPVAGTEVTINCSDLPAAVTADLNGGWVLLKLASPVTLAAATAYSIEAKTSSASQVSLFRGTATVDDLSRILVTTTTGAPAVGDDLIIAGEKTGAGTGNNFIVTMDNEATTDFGTNTKVLATPSLAICNGGTLRYGITSAKNYYLKQSGNVIVYAGGELDIGTVANPIPRDSSAVLEFDCAADSDFGLTIRNLGTFISQGLSRTSGKNFVVCKLNTDEAANSTSLGVDTDTGWLDNDEIAVATTTRTNTQCEKGTLNGAAGSSTLTVDGFAGTGGGLFNAHSGTSPTQAEVILLTRNVRIRSTNSAFMTFTVYQPTSTVDIDWTEFYYVGTSSVGVRAVEVNTTTGSFNMRYSSIHDGEGYGFVVGSGGAVNNITLQDTVFYNIPNNSTSANTILVPATTGTLTLSDIVIIRSQSNPNAVAINDLGSSYTNITVVGGVLGFSITESGATLGTFSGLVSHGNSSIGFSLNSAIGAMTNITSWRNGTIGFSVTSALELTLTNYTGFGNAASNLQVSGQIIMTIDNALMAGDSTFSTPIGIDNSNSSPIMKVMNSTFGVATGIYVAHTTGDFNFTSPTAGGQIIFNNCKLASATEISGQTSMTYPNSFVGSQKHDQTAGVHKTWKRYGTIANEVTTVHTGGNSFKMTPNNASNKLQSTSFFVAVANGATVTPSIYVYEDASYNGARARLILKRNDAIGITADTVIDTATASSDLAWEQLTGTTAAATDDGVMEFFIDCDGTAGNLFVDSFTAS